MTSVVAKPLPDGRLGVRVDPDATLEVPVYVTTPPDVNLGHLDADHVHRRRRQDRRAQRGGRPFLRAMIPGAAADWEGLQGAGARASMCDRQERDRSCLNS